MLRTFAEWRDDTTVPLRENAVAMTLSGLEKHCKDPGAVWGDIQNIFQCITTRCGAAAPRENHLTLMIRIASSAGKTQEALSYLRAMRPDTAAADSAGKAPSDNPPEAQKKKPAKKGSQGSSEKKERAGPRIRSVMPILTACSKFGDYDTAEKVFAQEVVPLKKEKGQLTEMEALQWQDCCFLRVGAVLASEALSEEKRREMVNSILKCLFSNVPALKVAGQTSGVNETYEREAKREVLACLEKVGYAPIPTATVDGGVCPEAGGVRLAARSLSRQHLQELQVLIERLCLDTANEKQKQEWAAFRLWLKEQVEAGKVFRYIIDGANVGHTMQNTADGSFSHQQIDAVADACQDPLIVIREHWLRPDTDLDIFKKKRPKPSLPQIQLDKQEAFDPESVISSSAGPSEGDGGLDEQLRAQLEGCEPEEESAAEQKSPGKEADSKGRITPAAPPGQTVQEQFRKKWEGEGRLLVAPHRVCDDWVAMYVACEMMLRGVENVQLVTNDIFRDHYWRMHQHEALPVWVERNLTKFILRVAPKPDDAFSPDFSAYTEPPKQPLWRTAKLHPPQPYSTYGQLTPDGKVWLIPFDTEPTTWAAARLCEA
eukprot:TRINITY_DN35283_c0_g1_i1.p1 TRINITY_DN35283_c0_g1~~TRINITY_DN35283_c0_g1_i1.p1  ORF type:complete len:637 (+),score=232.46 TRINITY_DN35283_c0_g1_i1:114-1913(+)